MSPRTYGGPGFALVERAARTIKRHRMFEAGDKVLVALSGGPDSTSLLDILGRLSEKMALEIEVAHVDHGLSSSAEEVAARVAHAAAEAGFEVHLVRAPDLEGPNLHARARSFRYAFMETVAAQIGAARIATGHTLDDRVETTLARFIHGGGTDVLAGLPPLEGLRARPLIGARRAETRSYCQEVGLSFHDDPGNDDERFERAAVRSKVLAAIEEHWGDGAVRAMGTAVERLAEDSRALRTLGERLFSDMATSAGDEVEFQKDAFLGIPGALRRRLLEQAIGRVRDRSGGIDGLLEALEADPAWQGESAVASGVIIRVDAATVTVDRGAARVGADG